MKLSARLARLVFASCLAVLALVGQQVRAGQQQALPEDTIARVGDQIIRYSDIERMINSSTMVGIGMPAPGTPERNTLRITLLDKAISANLLYLDALDKKLDRRDAYKKDVRRFADAMLRSIYRQKYIIGKIEVSDQEVLDYYHKHMDKDTPFTADLGEAIRARLRKDRYTARLKDMRRIIRTGVKVAIDVDRLDPAGDEKRASDTVVAQYAATGKVTCERP